MEGTRGRGGGRGYGRGGGRGFGGGHHGPRSGNQSHHNSRGGQSSHSAPKAPNFDRIDRQTTFFNGENVEGVSLLTDLDLTMEIRYRLGKFCHGTTDFFPAMWPVSLSPDNVRMLSSTSYVVVPKPVGPRFFMYVDTAGTVYLENMTQHVFCVDEDHQIKMVRRDGQPIKNTVLDGILTRQKTEDSSEEDPLKTSGRITFCIQDAIRCNGEDLTGMGILERIAFVQEELMKPRLDALNQNKTSQENEAFTLDIAEYKEAHNAEDYLSSDFKDSFKYPYRALVFVPKREGYKCGTCHSVLQWAEDDDQECSFLLKIPREIEGVKPKEGELYVGGPYRSMIQYCKIPLTDEIQEFNGKIIDCKYADNQWVFVKVRNDRQHPNGRRTVVDKQKTLEHPLKRDLLLTTLDESKGRN